MTLLEHIKSLNTTAKKKDRNSYCEISEDIKFWNDIGIHTIEEFEKQMIIEAIRNIYKDIYGCKPKEDFNSMTQIELDKYLNNLCIR